jgi:outer membrane protein assembly factor BamB
VFRLYPNSLAAEESLFEAAQAQARLGRPDEEIAAWRLFTREFGTSSRAPEALARLVHVLERKGQVAAAASALRRLARAFPEAEVPEGEGRAKARDFAERRLRSEAYARAAADTPLARLGTPLRRTFEYVDPEFPEGAPLRVGGAPPGWAKDLLLMHYAGARGAVLRGLDLAGRAPRWKLPVGNLEFAAFVEEGLLVADDSSVRLVNGEMAEGWRYPAADAPKQRLRKFTLSGTTLFFFTDDPRGEGALVLVALDAVRGTVLWMESFEGIPFSRPLAAGDGIVVATVSPGRLHLFDAETGKRRLEAPFAPGLSAQVAYASEEVVLLMAEGRFVEAYDLPAGTLRWRTSLAGVSTRGLDVSGGELLLLGVRAKSGREEDEALLSVVNLKSGKLVRVREKLESSDPRFMMVEGKTAYVVSREKDGGFTVRAVGLEDLSTRWEAKAGGGRKSTLLPPGLAKDHLLIPSFEQEENGKYGYAGTLLDKRGGTVQNIRSGEGFERPPEATLANDAVIFSVDSRVDVHR